MKIQNRLNYKNYNVLYSALISIDVPYHLNEKVRKEKINRFKLSFDIVL